MNDILSADNRILQNPELTVGIVELAESSVNFAVRPWVKMGEYWRVYFNLIENVTKRFDAE